MRGKRSLGGWVAPIVALAFAAPRAFTDPVLLFHVMPASFSACESLGSSTLRCNGVSVSSPSSQDLFVWVLVADVYELGGLQFGVSYPGSMNVQAWTLCTGGQQIPDAGWPASGTGNALTWGLSCSGASNDPKRVGFFYVPAGSLGEMNAMEDPRAGGMLWSNCEGGEPMPLCSRSGRAAIGTGVGFLPPDCACTTGFIEENTWGRIKNTYQSP